MKVAAASLYYLLSECLKCSRHWGPNFLWCDWKALYRLLQQREEGKVFGMVLSIVKFKRSVCICMYRFTNWVCPILSTFFQEKMPSGQKQRYMSFNVAGDTDSTCSDSSNAQGVIEVLECTRCINGITEFLCCPFFVHRCDSVIPLRRSKWQLWCLLVPATFFHCRPRLQYSHRTAQELLCKQKTSSTRTDRFDCCLEKGLVPNPTQTLDIPWHVAFPGWVIYLIGALLYQIANMANMLELEEVRSEHLRSISWDLLGTRRQNMLSRNPTTSEDLFGRRKIVRRQIPYQRTRKREKGARERERERERAEKKVQHETLTKKSSLIFSSPVV